MNMRSFVLLERLQRLDERLRLTRSSRHSHPLEIARLHARKLFVRERLSRISADPVVLPA